MLFALFLYYEQYWLHRLVAITTEQKTTEQQCRSRTRVQKREKENNRSSLSNAPHRTPIDIALFVDLRFKIPTKYFSRNQSKISKPLTQTGVTKNCN